MDVNALIGMGHGLAVAISRFCMGRNCGNCEGVAYTGGYGKIMPTTCGCDCHGDTE